MTRTAPTGGSRPAAYDPTTSRWAPHPPRRRPSAGPTSLSAAIGDRSESALDRRAPRGPRTTGGRVRAPVAAREPVALVFGGVGLYAGFCPVAPLPALRRGRPSVWGAGCPDTSLRPTCGCLRADSPPTARPCSGWGMPGHRCHHRCRWALTPPFHPHLCRSPLRARWPSAVCSLLRLPRVAPPGGWPASCPVESGRSSSQLSPVPRPPDQLLRSTQGTRIRPALRHHGRHGHTPAPHQQR